jgi:Immunity protein 50
MDVNLFQQSEIIKSIFNNDVLSFEAIELSKIEIDCNNGWYFKAYFNLKSFPSNPPVKWQIKKFNKAHIGLGFIENEIISFQNSELTPIEGELKIIDLVDYKKIIFIEKDESIIFELKCKWISVISLTGYCQ